MGTQSPVHDEEQQKPALPGLQLTGQQRALLEALADIGPHLSEMYLGALIVLQEPANGERFTQSAHTLREIINAIPRSVGHIDASMQERLGDRLQKPQLAWESAIARSACRSSSDGWSGTIDQPLRKALQAIEEFFSWKRESRPSRRTEIAESLRRMDSSALPLPEALEGLAVSQWDFTRDYFIAVCHYRKTVDEGEFHSYLNALERFFLDRLRPRTFADFDVLDNIIAEAERGN